MRVAAVFALLVMVVAVPAGFQGPGGGVPGAPPPPPVPADLSAFAPRTAVAALEAVSQRFDERAAMDLVVFMDRFWRNAGNAGFDQSIDRIKSRLEAAGFTAQTAGPAKGPSLWIEQSGTAPGWDYTVGTLSLAVLPEAFNRPMAVPTGLALIGLGVSLWRDQRTPAVAPAPTAVVTERVAAR